MKEKRLSEGEDEKKKMKGKKDNKKSGKNKTRSGASNGQRQLGPVVVFGDWLQGTSLKWVKYGLNSCKTQMRSFM